MFHLVAGRRDILLTVSAASLLVVPAFRFDDYASARYAWAALAWGRSGTADLSAYPLHVDFVHYHGRVLAAVAPALPFLEGVVVRAGDGAAALAGLPAPDGSARAYQLAWWLLFTMTSVAVIAACIFTLARRRGASPRQAAVRACLVVAGTPVVTLAEALRQTLPLIALTMVCLVVIDEKSESSFRGQYIVTGGVGGLAFLVDNQGALVVGCACLAVLASRRLWATIVTALSFLPAAVAQLLYNRWSTGGWFTFAPIEWYRQERPPAQAFPLRALDLLIGPRHGVFLWVPVLAVVMASSIQAMCYLFATKQLPGRSTTFAAALATSWFVMHVVIERASKDAAVGPRYAMLWIVPALALSELTSTRVRSSLAVLGVFVNYPAALLGPLALDVAIWEPLRIVGTYGPLVQWTSMFTPIGPQISNSGITPINIPTGAGAVLSAIVVLLIASVACAMIRLVPAETRTVPTGGRATKWRRGSPESAT